MWGMAAFALLLGTLGFAPSKTFTSTAPRMSTRHSHSRMPLRSSIESDLPEDEVEALTMAEIDWIEGLEKLKYQQLGPKKYIQATQRSLEVSSRLVEEARIQLRLTVKKSVAPPATATAPDDYQEVETLKDDLPAGGEGKAPAKAGKSVTVAADGACSGNPGPGGWAVVLQIENGQREHHEFSGFEADTTNNRMELQAAIQAVRLCTERGLGPVKLLVDSQYVAKGITEWIHSWKAKGWRTASKKPVKNMDLWQELDRVMSDDITVTWVKGHADNSLHNRADVLAQAAIEKGSV